jgi:hypothetical protein
VIRDANNERPRRIALVLLPGVHYLTGQYLDLERIAAVRNQFGNTAPNPVAASEQARYPGVVLNQIGIMYESAQNADETAMYGSRITNEYD